MVGLRRIDAGRSPFAIRRACCLAKQAPGPEPGLPLPQIRITEPISCQLGPRIWANRTRGRLVPVSLRILAVSEKDNGKTFRMEVIMAINELLDIVKPPEHPVEIGDFPTWRAFEKRMGLEFPKDWYDLVVAYGSGWFGGAYELEVINPFAREFPEILSAELEILQDVEHYDAGGDLYPVYPARPGLFTWGRDANGYRLHWYTDGSPNEWPIVVTIAREEDAGEYRMSMTTFLAEAFKGEIQEPLRYEPMVNGIFVPAKV